jgi:predicted Rossmann-fold nucleotide-binding protein
MEAANRGASESIGLNIALPHQQYPFTFITPELCFLVSIEAF